MEKRGNKRGKVIEHLSRRAPAAHPILTPETEQRAELLAVGAWGGLLDAATEE